MKVLALLLAALGWAPRQSQVVGDLRLHELTSRVFGNTRLLRVWLLKCVTTCACVLASGAAAQTEPLWVAGIVPVAPQFRQAPQRISTAASTSGFVEPTERTRRVRNGLLGGAIGAVTGVVVCTLISNLVVNTEVDGITWCTRRGYLILGGAGAILGATIGVLSTADRGRGEP